jgi:glycosyltransferase involved in cell wall biosynthesis
MKILWVKTDYLHPTTRGGQIRTLEMLRRLRQRHEVHYVCFAEAGDAVGPAGSREYCAFAYPVPHTIPEKTSPAFLVQLAGGLFSPKPVAVSRFASRKMLRAIAELQKRQRFDSVVCDFLFPAPNIPDLASCVLFQHNVESVIWQRRLENAAGPIRRAYLRLQAERMLKYEGAVCRAVRKVIAVSAADAQTMRRLYGVENVAAIATGVDLDYFAPPAAGQPKTDLVFVGSMDWMPNTDGALWFTKEVLPLIRRSRPDCSLAIVGRKPTAAVVELGTDPRITVTGTVDDVRPWLFGSTAAIVPLRMGGGTRLKIYEAMAAGIPVVSTTIGAEGLEVSTGRDILIADSPAEFAGRCLALLDSSAERARIAAAALQMVAARGSWEAVARDFERLLTS